MTFEPAEIITDDRHPGWRAVLLYDECAGQPWGDALAPALIVGDCRRDILMADQVYVPQEAERIAEAWRHFADHRLFERYLRQWRGVTTIATATDRDTTVIIFDTGDYRAHAGITGTIDLKYDQAEWQAYLDGDVYGVVIEHQPAPPTQPEPLQDPYAGDGWLVSDSCWGFFGLTYAIERAGEMVHDCATWRHPPAARPSA